jgi:hypothetical protein
MRLTFLGVGVGVSLVMAVLGPGARANSLAVLDPWVRDCFATQRRQACEQALLQAEALQQRAADRDRYPCQSMVLGLQADVVMVQLRQGRGAGALETWAAVRQRCSGL